MDTHKKTTQSAGAEVGTSADAVIQFLTQRGILGDKKIDDEKVRANTIIYHHPTVHKY